jgi:uncharacterized membrane protein
MLPWIGAALLLYVVALALTMVVNVPLNDTLAAAGSPDRLGDLAAVREKFEATWVRANVARAVTCTAAFCCLSWALMLSAAARR